MSCPTVPYGFFWEISFIANTESHTHTIQGSVTRKDKNVECLSEFNVVAVALLQFRGVIWWGHSNILGQTRHLIQAHRTEFFLVLHSIYLQLRERSDGQIDHYLIHFCNSLVHPIFQWPHKIAQRLCLGVKIIWRSFCSAPSPSLMCLVGAQERAFSVAAPLDFGTPSHWRPGWAPSLLSFRKQVKTFLCRQAFP